MRPTWMRARSVSFVFQAFFNRIVVAPFIHVDEVDHNQTCQIAQAHLTRDFFCRL